MDERITIDPEALQRLKRRQLLEQELKLSIFPRRPTVRILMLVDAGISFNQFYFGLSEVLDTLYDISPGFPGEGLANFSVTKVHRFNDPNPPTEAALKRLYAPNAESFRFTGATLRYFAADGSVASERAFQMDDFDQVWLFGFSSSSTFPQALNDAELAILYRWMNERDGGVFATGDHAELGAALCSRIPRVRSMRRWRGDVPPQNGPERHDTSRPGHDNPASPLPDDESKFFSFDDESDDVPQKILVKPYLRFTSGGRVLHKTVHPILCGTTTRGVIDVLPDHPHEGEVVLPETLTDTPVLSGYAFREYPDHGTSPLSPEIIARAQILDGITNANSFKRACESKTFGVIGAYNGHVVGVGRVVTDSTWHHWFDVNLTGRMVFGSDVPGGEDDSPADPRKRNGFLDTAAGKQALAKIRNYFRNVALWLSPPSLQRAISHYALYQITHSYPLIEEARVDLDVRELGTLGYDALIRRYGACAVTRFLPILYRKWPLPIIEPPLRRPWSKEQVLGHRDVEELVLGEVLKELLPLRDAHLESGAAPSEAHIVESIKRGTAHGVASIEASLPRFPELLRGELAALVKAARGQVGG